MGKICVITGANAGIGKKTAIGLGKLGFHIVMMCRNKERAEIAREEIKKESGNDNIDLLIVDLASLKSIRKGAEDFKAKYGKLHVLINNGGVFNYKRIVTDDGFESTFGVNYLAHFLLTNLLLDIIEKSAPSRIINLSSDIHKFFKINMDDLMSEQKYNSQKAYSNSKFAMVLHAYALARRLERKGVSVNAVHPGHAATKMTQPTGRVSRFINSRMGATPEEAARTSIHVASSPEIETITGKYFKKCKAEKSHKWTYDEALQERLWKISEELVNI